MIFAALAPVLTKAETFTQAIYYLKSYINTGPHNLAPALNSEKNNTRGGTTFALIRYRITYLGCQFASTIRLYF